MEIEENDVVQIVPEHRWGGCFVIVSEVKSWGIQGYVQIPMQGQAYIRLNTGEFERIGKSLFIIHRDADYNG